MERNEMEDLFKLNNNENSTNIETKYEKAILEPFLHLNEINGKGFLNIFVQVYNYWMKLEKVEIEFITNLGHWAHSASLLMDDIQDSSELRRGRPAAHVIYGVGRTIAAIDFSTYFFFGEKNCIADPTKICMIALNCSENVLQGQIMEIYWRDNFICPSEEDYFDMIIKKTGNFFLVVSNYMELFSKVKVDLKKLSILFGLYYQITDDYRGLKSKSLCEAKGFCDDIREGKFILPIIHAIKSRPNDKRISDILKMHTNDVHMKMKCLELMEEFGSMEYTRNKIIHFKNLIILEMETLGFNDKMKKLFELQSYDK